MAVSNTHGALAIDTTTAVAALPRETSGSEIREMLAIASGRA
jgi:hypothetical protein